MSPLYLYYLWFTWTILTVYSSAELKINGNRASPNYDSVQQMSGSHKYLTTQTIQEVVFKYIFINLTNFMAHQTQ